MASLRDGASATLDPPAPAQESGSYEDKPSEWARDGPPPATLHGVELTTNGKIATGLGLIVLGSAALICGLSWVVSFPPLLVITSFGLLLLSLFTMTGLTFLSARRRGSSITASIREALATGRAWIMAWF